MMLKRLLLLAALPLLLLLSVAAHAQDRTVTGKVTDSTGAGLAGVTLTVKGTKTAVQSGADGTFTIKMPAGATRLVASSVGYAATEVDADGNNLTVTMRAGTATALNEVVVVGYGTQRKRDLTGAVASVSSKDFVKGAITSPEQLISGKVAGVQISTNSGAPGAGSRIRIRGGASLNASNDPLVVIDGVPVDNSGNISGSVNPLNLINPNDIENFTILKDPSAAAIYGSRASNGVILITTKKGSRGKVRYNVTAQLFVQTVPKHVDVLSADQIRAIVATKGSSIASLAGTANTDWQDEIYKTALGQDINLSAAGAFLNGKLPFRISGGFYNQDGILRTGNFQRQTAAINLSPKLFKEKLKIDLNLKGARTSNRFADEGAIGGAVSFDPTHPVKVNSPRFGGFFTYVDSSSLGTPTRDQFPINPVSRLEMRDDKSEVLRSLGNIQLDYTIPGIKGLRANLNLGYDVQQGTGTTVVPDSAPASYRRYNIVNNRIVNYGGINNHYKSTRSNLLSEFYLNYTNDLKSINSRIELLAGTGYQDFRFTTYNYADYRYDGSKIANSDPTFPITKSSYALLSYYGRLTYTLANKYVLTASVRTDGSSRFAKDNRWGLFPSVAVAWRINEEKFFENAKALSDLKLRVGLGTTGQQDGIDFYGYLPRYTLSNNFATYQLGSTYYNLYRPTAYDPNLKWETTTNLNAAIDYGLFRNRVTGSVEFFYRKTKDLLSVVPIALGTNFSNQLLTNVGNIESKGFEFSINGSIIKSKQLTWDIGFNITYTNPKITKLLLNPDPSFKGNLVGGIGGGTGNTIQIQAVGSRPNSFYVRKQIYDQNDKPIEGLYEDLNRDGTTVESERYVYKSPDAPVFMGINSNVYYGKWSGGFVARVNVGNYNYNNLQSSNGVYRSIVNPLGFLGNANVNYLETNFQNNQYFSDYYVQNASFLRMDNINVGYDAGQLFKGGTVRFTANVQNVFVITKYKGLDPEVNGGIDNQIYPRPRTFVIGANVNF